MDLITKSLDNVAAALNRQTESIAKLHADNSSIRTELRLVGQRIDRIEPTVQDNVLSVTAQRGAREQQQTGAENRNAIIRLVVTIAAAAGGFAAWIVDWLKNG